jgi:hypothetical protein
MEKSTKEALEIFKKNYSKWIQAQAHQQSGYEYEKSYVEMMQKVSEEVLQSTVESTGKGRKKNSKPA